MECRFVLVDAEVEDICSEVFKSLVDRDMASLKAFQGSSTLATWLTVVVRRICLRCLNKRPVDRATGVEIEQVQTPRSDEMDTVTSLIRQEEFVHVQRLIGQLKPADQMILSLHFREELSYNEIGDRMSISTNAVGPKLHRAQQRLRKLVRRQGE